MGRTVLVLRLAARDMRRHVAQAVLLLLAIAAAATVLTLGLALDGVTSQPYQQTRAATKGPDVVAYLRSPAQAAPLTRASGVTATAGPFPIAAAIVNFNGLTAGAEAEGRSGAPAAVDQPKLTAGSWVRPGGVVIERTFAEALGASAGDHLTLNGQSFTVAGIAVTAANPPFPNLCYSGGGGCDLALPGESPGTTGLMWTTEPDALRLSSASNLVNEYVLDLKLGDPGQAQAFVDRYGAGAGPRLATWQGIASADALLVADEQSVLTPGAVLLALLAIATVAVLVGSRLAERTRRVGLLKAAGGTPGLIAATFLAENLMLAVIAGAAGLAGGWLTAPLITSPGAALIGAPGTPSRTPSMIGGVMALALAVALASTLVPAIQAARTSTVSALADAARAPRRRGTLIKVSRRLPGPALFGLRLAARRPRRALLSAASIMITVAGITAVLAFHATVSKQLAAVGATAGGLADPVVSRDEQMLLVLTVALVALAALNAIFTAWATALDARRPSALMRALGASSRQVGSGLAAAQVLAALPGAIAGVPLGIGLFDLVGPSRSAPPSASWAAVTVTATLFIVAGLTSIPASIASRQPVTEVLRSETG
jgi:putative ABC transport system permease protein